MRVAIRLHDVITEFELRFQFVARELFPWAEHKEHHSEYNETRELQDILFAVLDHPEFFPKLSPVVGGVEAVQEIMSAGHQVLLFTSVISPESATAHQDQQRWIDRYFGHGFNYDHFVVMRDRSWLDADFVINDDLVEGWTENSSAELILFGLHPVNGNRRIVSWENWKDILPELVS